MTTYAPPVVRCGRCGGWLTQRTLHPQEAPTLALVCAWCAEEFEVLGGKLVSMSRPADATVTRDLSRHNHAAAVNATTWRKRERRT